MMLNGPRTLPRPSATASKIGWCSEATCSLVVIGVPPGMATPPLVVPAFFFQPPRFPTHAWRRGRRRRSIPSVNGQGSGAYTDFNTLLEQHARQRPDKTFIEIPDEGSRITFGAFEALTRRFANLLASEGVSPGERISLLADNGIEGLLVFWGALRAGVIVNPINVEIREARSCTAWRPGPCSGARTCPSTRVRSRRAARRGSPSAPGTRRRRRPT